MVLFCTFKAWVRTKEQKLTTVLVAVRNSFHRIWDTQLFAVWIFSEWLIFSIFSLSVWGTRTKIPYLLFKIFRRTYFIPMLKAECSWAQENNHAFRMGTTVPCVNELDWGRNTMEIIKKGGVLMKILLCQPYLKLIHLYKLFFKRDRGFLVKKLWS